MDTPNPWDRMRDVDGTLEPARWFARFTAYRTAGPGRSLLGCVNAEQEKSGKKRNNRVPGAWDKAFARWHWRTRAEAWDAHERARYEAELEDARLEAIANQREDARLMRAKGRAMLDQLPMFKETGADKAGVPVIISPAHAAEYRAAQALLDSAAKLEAARLGLPTEQQRMDITSAGEKLETGATDADLIARAAAIVARRTGGPAAAD